MSEIEFITDSEIYDRVILGETPKAREFLWIATSDIKDLYVREGRGMAPFLKTLSKLVQSGVAIRLLHASEPGPAFRKDFDRYPDLFAGLERIHCPRVHFKCIVVDGEFAYTGSGNLTGAGVGAKSSTRRNFESGIVTNDTELIAQIMAQFDSVWMGSHCDACRRKPYCTEYRHILRTEG